MGLLYSIGIIQPVLIAEIDGMCQNSVSKHWFTFQMTAHFSQARAPFYSLFTKQMIVFLHKCKLLLMSMHDVYGRGILFFLSLHGILFAVPSGYAHYCGTLILHLLQRLTGQSKDCKKLLGSVVGVCFADFPFHVLQSNCNSAE